MLEKLLRWVKGYIKIRITGASRDRFINICSKNQIIMWKLCYNDDSVEAFISRKDFHQIDKFIKKTDAVIEIENKIGLPFLFYRYRKRKCFALGAAIFIGILYGFTLFIWDVNVQGTEEYTDEQIISDIVENYVPVGTLIKNVDCAALEKSLREKYEKVAWISCSIDGTRLNVSLTETIEPDMIENNDRPCNIIAAKDGIITDIIATSGSKTANVGDEVKKGDILITGVVNIFNEYDELLTTEYLPAAGYVYAVSKYNYSDEFNLEHYEKQYTGKKKQYFSLYWFGKTYTPYKASFKDEAYDSVTSDYTLKLGNTYYMPLGFRKTLVRSYSPVLSIYDNEEAVEKADRRLESYLDNLRKKGVEILENNVTINLGDDVCVAEGTIVVKELIGVPSDITLFEQGE